MPRRFSFMLALLSLGFIASLPAQPPPAPAGEFSNGVIVSVSEPASDVGLAVLKGGGNAVDAAVATAFALAVTHPAAGNIGGGGFMLIHPAGGDATVIEYRETAPTAATKDMFKKG